MGSILLNYTYFIIAFVCAMMQINSLQLSMHTTGVTRNVNFGKLQAGYLFPEIGRRRNAYLAKNPDAKIISLGIGDTTQPIPKHILSGLQNGAAVLGTKEGYKGYGDTEGYPDLRQKIATKLYKDLVDPTDIFVSDGAKCDIARLQMMFGSGVVSAVQDPSYPVYVDTSVIIGQTGEVNKETSQFEKIVYMPCNPENDFFPDVSNLPRADVYYLCSPNNPTGAAATRKQLESFVKKVKEMGSIIVFDAAYAPFIRNPDIPKTIYEIEGADEVAIEINSFSKYAGFTGVRLGWTVCPSKIKYKDGTPIRNDFVRLVNTIFNGASNVVQAGGLACLDDAGLAEIETLINYYLENARLLRETFIDLGFDTYGGTDAPYIFVHMKGQNSWDVFSEVLEKIQVVTIPGAGFGPGGTEFLRMSAFAPRESCVEACNRFREMYKK